VQFIIPVSTQRRHIQVRGTVQGVGFRPFVHQLAARHSLAGWVFNHAGGVEIEVEGIPDALEAFLAGLRSEAPPLARVETLDVTEVSAKGAAGFQILDSRAASGESQPVSPDAATCSACLGELLNPQDRRYRYPFTNCTNCGPRFTIIEGMSYDRPLTTMRHFTMCQPCRQEYEDPADRRFHAQPNACPACGPRLWLADRTGAEIAGEAIANTAVMLRAGKIVAVKGLGGFQLCCDATNEESVRLLRTRKRRPSKPFALMVKDLEAAQPLCQVSEAEAMLLQGPASPIVLMRRCQKPAHSHVAASVAPYLHELGVMLPYTPLHHLLLQQMDRPLVMTSGNLTEEPIARDNAEALARLGGLADSFLLHNRDIYARYDDSVARVVDGEERMLRRARGYCPAPIEIGEARINVLAFGAHLKNTFCIVNGGRAFVGPHIGDLDDQLSREHQLEALDTCLRLFRAQPGVVACDLHPDYASTCLAERWGEEQRCEVVRVQHHHAHIASVMAEHGLRGRLIGVAFDGTGHGPDGTVWGGEFLVCDEAEFTRAGHLAVVRQPGGDRCAREGWRMASAYLRAAGMDVDPQPAWLRDGPGAPDQRRWRLVSRLPGKSNRRSS
jgi:hydrogenase maturation protein HypF